MDAILIKLLDQIMTLGVPSELLSPTDSELIIFNFFFFFDKQENFRCLCKGAAALLFQKYEMRNFTFQTYAAQRCLLRWAKEYMQAADHTNAAVLLLYRGKMSHNLYQTGLYKCRREKNKQQKQCNFFFCSAIVHNNDINMMIFIRLNLTSFFQFLSNLQATFIFFIIVTLVFFVASFPAC